MQKKTYNLSNFSRNLRISTECYRPDNEEQVGQIFNEETGPFLVRGLGASYNDSCLLEQGNLIDSGRLNHFLAFNQQDGSVVAQAGVQFEDFFKIDNAYLPPVIPGTLHLTLGGGIAHDIHGKNNHTAGSFGQHLQWLEIQVGNKKFYCSPEEYPDLFYATIGGLGLTGMITRAAFKLKKSTSQVLLNVKPYEEEDLGKLCETMQQDGLHYDYQAAWLDFLNKKPKALLFLAQEDVQSQQSDFRLPSFSLPYLFSLRMIRPGLIKIFNQYYYKTAGKNKSLDLRQFNNPLDKIKNWNLLYGKKGLLQFQGIFNVKGNDDFMTEIFKIIAQHKAFPTLVVLKYFTQKGVGLMSFTQPGFCIAIDFLNNTASRQAILALNSLITEAKGRVYLAKDLFLTVEQYKLQYPKYQEFQDILQKYQSPMASLLSKRLGITP